MFYLVSSKYRAIFELSSVSLAAFSDRAGGEAPFEEYQNTMKMLKDTMVDAPSYSSLGAAPAKEEHAPVFRSLGAAPAKKVEDEPVSENALNTIHDALDNFKEALMNKCRRGRKEALLAALKPVLCSAENRAAIRKICAAVA